MPGRSLTREELVETVDALRAEGGSRKAAARRLGVSANTLHYRLRTLPADLAAQVPPARRGRPPEPKRPRVEQPRSNGHAPVNGEAGREAYLWARYKQHGELVARDELAERYQWLVEKRMLAKLSKLPGFVDRDMLSSAAQYGLHQALEGFDPTAGYKFSTFARRRIDGQMADDLRAWEPNSRKTVADERRRSEAAEEIAKRGGRPTDEQIAQAVGSGWRKVDTKSLSRELFENDAGRAITLGDWFGSQDAEQTFRLLDGLTMVQQVLLYCYYWRGSTMKQIGAALGLSESRVSQLHSQTCKELRRRGRDTILERLV